MRIRLARKYFPVIAIVLLSLMVGCVVNDAPNGNPAVNSNSAVTNSNASAPPASSTDAAPYGSDTTLTPEEIEHGRMDPGWKKAVQMAPSEQAKATSNPEKYKDITAERANSGQIHLPLGGDVAGPSVFRAQVLLDRARFSPGIVDGKWGKNSEKAVFWLQKREGLTATGQVDSATLQRLTELAGRPDKFVADYNLTAEDVAGPFAEIPDDIYAKAKMDCMCYESLEEKLAEKFHVSPDLLRQLNPGANLKGMKAGDTLKVPNLRADNGGTGAVARLVISDTGHYVHALDANGQVVYHFPSTLGSSYDPSPTGDYKITNIAKDPWWHYQPALLESVPDNKPDARIPPGPNNAVGAIWMSLSAPHFGIHGTSAPETIGYVTSAGCVRLTNWDALFLGSRVKPGTPVEFRDT